MTKSFVFFLILFLTKTIFSQERIEGVNIVSVKEKLVFDQLKPIQQLDAEWISIVPFCDIDSSNSARLVYDQPWEYYGERLKGVRQMVQLAHENNFSVMLKPQVRESNGRYVGHINYRKKRDWKSFEQSYRTYIFAFIKIAQEENIALFCVGTELGRFVKERPKFWKKLIKDIRKIYTGKLTYAANWDDYEKFPHWKELDYIGVDAYFPISKKQKPTLKELENGWEPILAKMEKTSQLMNKKILLTEFGYRSIQRSAFKPWVHFSDEIFDENSQVNSLEALFKSVWKKDFVAGGFLWRWYPYHPSSGGKGNTKYTVQNKLGEEIVRKYYTF
ncbi:MAG TPA: glycoside hydrolase [Crocinitomicaceae bacterium]|nr:glycoside hydrolase [Crocinitomicaceae bacterium]